MTLNNRDTWSHQRAAPMTKADCHARRRGFVWSDLPALLLVASVISAVGCKEKSDGNANNGPVDSSTKAPIRIGAIFPLTGDAAQWGIPPRNGAVLAVEEINEAGGINGRKFELVVEDTACDPRQGVSAYNKVVATASPAVVIGAVCSGVTLAVAPISEQKQIVLISPASTNPGITDAGDFVFRVVPSDALRGKVFADYVYSEAGVRGIDILYINNESGIGNRDSFKKQFTLLGGKVVLEEAYAQNATDLRTQLTKIKNSVAEAVMVVSFPNDTILVMKQAQELEIGKPLFFQTEAVEDPNVLREAGQAAEGAVYILPAEAEGEAAEEFAVLYDSEYGEKPELFAAEAYDIVHLIADAIRTNPEGTITGSIIRDYLYSVSGFNGASGVLTFDEHGDVLKPMAIKRITDRIEPELLVRK